MVNKALYNKQLSENALNNYITITKGLRSNNEIITPIRVKSFGLRQYKPVIENKRKIICSACNQ